MDAVRVEVDDLMQQSYVYPLTAHRSNGSKSQRAGDGIENLRGIGPNWKSGSQGL
jgi:hypothetical protein